MDTTQVTGGTKHHSSFKLIFTRTMAVRRRKQRLTIIVVIALVFFILFRHHIVPAVYLIKAPFHPQRYLSADDNFDITFASYTREQPDLNVVYTVDGEAHNQTSQVPPIIHYILLAPAVLQPKWNESQESCRKFHPKYNFIVWDDQAAERFMREDYPDYFKIWRN